MKKRAFALFLAVLLLGGCNSREEQSANVSVQNSAPKSSAVSSSSENLISAPSEPPETRAPEIDNETFLEYGELCLYDFKTQMSAGRGKEDILLSTEAYYGLKAYTVGRDVYIKAYDNTDSALEITSASLETADGAVKFVTITDHYTKLPTEDENGLLKVGAAFSNGLDASLCVYLTDESAWLCQAEKLTEKELSEYKTRRVKLAQKLRDRNVTPKNSVSLDNVTYPCPEFDENFRCDTERWAEFSHTLVKPEWSEERKLLAFFDWITENIAYDTYGTELSLFSRAGYHMDYSGKYSVYDLRAGVCMDYAHILLIMCRANGIPATTIGSKSRNHIWNVVYINGRWVELDATCSAKYEVTSEDTSARSLFGNRQPYDGFCDVILRKNPYCALSDDTFVKFCLQENSDKIY